MALTAAEQREFDLSFEREALPWLDDVYRFALSLTRNEADADDIVQETFMRAYRSWHTFERGSDARRWLFTISRNAFLRTRERARHQVELDDGDVEAVASQLAEATGGRSDAEQLLARHRPHVIFEAYSTADRSTQGAYDRLSEQGYEFFLPEKGGLTPLRGERRESFNIVAVHPTRKSETDGLLRAHG